MRRIVAGVEASENLPKGRYDLKGDTMSTPLAQPGSILEPQTEVAR